MADRPQRDEPAAAGLPPAEDPPVSPVSVADNAVATENITATTMLQTVLSATNSLAFTFAVYALGFWRIAAASTWVLLPLMAVVSVVRDRWREAGRIRRRRAQLAAAANERDLITANVSELPSWVFFPDIHRAEWLNQVPKSHPNNVNVLRSMTMSIKHYRLKNLLQCSIFEMFLSNIVPAISPLLKLTNSPWALNVFSHRSLHPIFPSFPYTHFYWTYRRPFFFPCAIYLLVIYHSNFLPLYLFDKYRSSSNCGHWSVCMLKILSRLS